MRLPDWVPKAVSLAALAYLGFYVFGLIMGIYSAGGVIGFTIVAVVLAALYLGIVIRNRRAAAAGGNGEAMREAHRVRERRGF